MRDGTIPSRIKRQRIEFKCFEQLPENQDLRTGMITFSLLYLV